MTDPTVSEISPLIFDNPYAKHALNNWTVNQHKVSVWLILLSAGLERLAFYSLAGNLILFLTSDHIYWTSTHSIIVSYIFFGTSDLLSCIGTSYISAIGFAWISDTKFGRARTIIMGFALYIIGYAFISLLSDDNKYQLRDTFCGRKSAKDSFENKFFQEHCIFQTLIALICIALGTGAVQANMAVFGAEQIQEQKTTSEYFDKYYTIVNVGGLIAFGFIAYIQQNDSYFIGYIVPLTLLTVAAILFIIGLKYYIHRQSHSSIVRSVIPVFMDAFRKWRNHRSSAQLSYNKSSLSKPSILLNNQAENNDQLSITIDFQSWSFLDHAKISNQGRFPDHIVDDVKSLWRIAVVFLLLMPYWLIYFQIETSFVVQGVHMKVMEMFPMNNSHGHMPVIWLSLGNQMIIILTIFFLNTFVYKRLEASGRSFSIRSRLFFGLTSALLSMCMAGIVEIFRQKSCSTLPNILQVIGNTNYTAADMPIFYQLPQYLAIGISEVFASVAGLELAYIAAPRSAQSLIMSLRFYSVGFSSFIGAAYTATFLKTEEDLQFDNTDCQARNHPQLFCAYFFGLGGFQLVSILALIFCDRRFRILQISRQKFKTRLFVTPNSSLSNT